MTELHWTEVDGVTTLWVDTPGPLSAGLLFRAGRADETLATGGRIHLIEHLAFASLDGALDRRSGFVGGVVTGFVTTDIPEEVSAFLLGISRALRSVPGARLENEKQVLEAEAAARPYSFSGGMLAWRYGAAGYGLIAMPEYGLRGARLPQLHGLAAQRFTSANAVLWLSGPPPAGLSFKLQRGVKQPAPRLTAPVLPAFPCWTVDNQCGGVAASAVVPRVPAAAALFRVIAGKRLHERLRKQGAVSYAPSVSYEPFDAATAHLVFYADSDKARRAELAAAFADFFERLGDIKDAEVQSARKELLDEWVGPLAPPAEVQARADVQLAAMDWIFGEDYESREVLADGWQSVTRADVAAFGRDVQRGALFALPGEAQMRPVFGEAAPASTAPAVEGRQVVPCDSPVSKARLVYGPDGVSLHLPNDEVRTVRYAQLAAALSYEDGCVMLTGSDATRVSIEPTLWRDGPRVCREIRERVPEHLLLDRGARAADAIPRPSTTRWQRLRARMARREPAGAR